MYAITPIISHAWQLFCLSIIGCCGRGEAGSQPSFISHIKTDLIKGVIVAFEEQQSFVRVECTWQCLAQWHQVSTSFWDKGESDIRVSSMLLDYHAPDPLCP